MPMDIKKSEDFLLWWQLSQAAPVPASFAFAISCFAESFYLSFQGKTSPDRPPVLFLGFGAGGLGIMVSLFVGIFLASAEGLVGMSPDRSHIRRRKPAVWAATLCRAVLFLIYWNLAVSFARAVDPRPVFSCILGFVAAASNAVAIYLGLAKYFGQDRTDETYRDEVEESQMLLDTEV